MSKPAGAPGTRFAGTEGDGSLIFIILGFLMLFGGVSVIAGIWQLVYSRRNKYLISALIILGLIFLIAAPIFRAL
jgi:hypothetical protein